jgi:hypothetical protein
MTQEVEVTNQGGFYPAVFNIEFDKLTILVQQLDEKVKRSLITAVTAGLTPSVPVLAGAFIRYNAGGTAFETVTLNELAGLTANNTLIDNDMVANSTVRASSKNAVVGALAAKADTSAMTAADAAILAQAKAFAVAVAAAL